jgi:hypothetical protein
MNGNLKPRYVAALSPAGIDVAQAKTLWSGALYRG